MDGWKNKKEMLKWPSYKWLEEQTPPLGQGKENVTGEFTGDIDTWNRGVYTVGALEVTTSPALGLVRETQLMFWQLKVRALLHAWIIYQTFCFLFPLEIYKQRHSPFWPFNGGIRVIPISNLIKQLICTLVI